MSLGRKDKNVVPIGLVFSLTGSYSIIGQELYNGSMLAVEEVNAADYDFELAPIPKNPGGNLSEYRNVCEILLKQEDVIHIVGCYTSSSRKEVIPIFEKYDGLLWYPSHYEGFESCNNVIYTGASPNQHIVPLAAYMLPAYGNQAYCIGSNYIWAWENNRIMREIVTGCGGTVEFEKYLPVGSLDVDHIVDEIMTVKPSFVFSSLIGTTSYAFMEAFQRARQKIPDLATNRMPICSCTLSEPELNKLKTESMAGHIVSSVYFQTKERPENTQFVREYKKKYGENKVTSADAEAAYNAVRLLALAIHKADSQEMDDVKYALYSINIGAPQGSIKVDPDNNHCYLTPALGVSNTSGQFDILWSSNDPVKPDPYLVNFNVQKFKAEVELKDWPSQSAARARLKVVK